MKYFGVEIYDGVPFKDIEIDDTRKLEDQWWEFGEDITCIDYHFREFKFYLDVSFRREKKKDGSGFFIVEIMEGPFTKGYVFFYRTENTITELKKDMQEAADLIQRFKEMTDDEILNYRTLRKIVR